MATTRDIVVVTAGISQPSSTRLLADRLTSATVEALHGHAVEASVRVVEVRDLAHDLVDNLLTGFPSPRLRSAIDAVTSADGIIAVSPVFSASRSSTTTTWKPTLRASAAVGTAT